MSGHPVLRQWRTHVDEARADEYERFARERSLPMFREHDGLIGVLFAREGTECVVITLWENAEAVRRLEESSLYQRTVAEISAAGFLTGTSSVEAIPLHDMWFSG
ncbi:antibiotic biosynthesis monooxygenase [Allokutzneria sp. A3M-2-11 16]|uniref:antibiotic biosynthesis monooxygenase n=1 Tax=Allokutzneria sp. A3M-2-11 16 TaxID=2962043 RepID=UPI0020B853FA|nr:antibiotic biosynthesis monooxygenase [Allokutzneria sp. A3M-2-11 16]MCP3805003.1 antibiotic biosynthesis monooxygenase [Allokutzneria sp. A3M-2-11 16]